MFQVVLFTYGFLASFVLSGATRNRKMARPNPQILEFTGLVLCGFSGALFVGLLLVAFLAPARIPQFAF